MTLEDRGDRADTKIAEKLHNPSFRRHLLKLSDRAARAMVNSQVTFESPPGLKKNVQRTYSTWPVAMVRACPKPGSVRHHLLARLVSRFALAVFADLKKPVTLLLDVVKVPLSVGTPVLEHRFHRAQENTTEVSCGRSLPKFSRTASGINETQHFPRSAEMFLRS